MAAAGWVQMTTSGSFSGRTHTISNPFPHRRFPSPGDRPRPRPSWPAGRPQRLPAGSAGGARACHLSGFGKPWGVGMLARVDPPRFFVPRSAQPNPDLVRGGAATRRMAAMGVAVPPTPLTPAEPVLRELFAGTFLTYHDIFGEEVPLDTVLGWIRKLPADAVLGVCSVLSRYSSVHSERDRSQILAHTSVLSPELPVALHRRPLSPQIQANRVPTRVPSPASWCPRLLKSEYAVPAGAPPCTPVPRSGNLCLPGSRPALIEAAAPSLF
jgi:hypothetical protein